MLGIFTHLLAVAAGGFLGFALGTYLAVSIFEPLFRYRADK